MTEEQINELIDKKIEQLVKRYALRRHSEISKAVHEMKQILGVD